MLLRALAADLRERLGDVASVIAEHEDGRHVVEVRPSDDGPCPFTVYCEDADDTAVTVQLGRFTTANVYTSRSDELAESVHHLVEALVAGNVTEAVWYRGDRPYRALAVINGITYSTRQGLAFGGKSRRSTYSPYLPAST